MLISEAQREMRVIFRNGAVGQLVSGVFWLLSAALATFVSHRAGIISLIAIGFFTYPLTQLALRLFPPASQGGKGCMTGKTVVSARRENPFNALAMQTAFIVPLLLPLVGVVSLYKENLFYPALMLVLGVHYMPFITLYGMRSFAFLAAFLLMAGVSLGMGWLPNTFALGGWITGAALLIFSAWAFMRPPEKLPKDLISDEQV